MPPAPLPRQAHFVGIKGTGMSALAELYHRSGVSVTGSDTTETFYTDQVLREIGISYSEGFDPENIPEGCDLLVYSAAYDPETHPEIVAARKRGVPVLVYTEALGRYSRGRVSVGVSGVHGKTTTTAMAGTLVDALGLGASVLAGSAVTDFGGTSVLFRGEEFFVAETCEYRRHFLDFDPSIVVVTNVEADHLDYFRDGEDVELAFLEYLRKLPPEGTVIYCADDPGALSVAERIAAERDDLHLFGYRREGSFRPLPGGARTEEVRIIAERSEPGRIHFGIEGIEAAFALTIPGTHNVLNATAAVVATCTAAAIRYGGTWRSFAHSRREAIAEGLLSFSGSRRRSETIGEAKGIRVMDDYGHHPTEIVTTLRGLREFYDPERLIVDFMSHTYTRTFRLLDEFASSFGEADIVVINEIYASAREQFDGSIGGEELANAIRRNHLAVVYRGSHEQAVEYLLGILREGDLLLTLGAGDNWQIGREVLRRLQE
ncbi:MAG: UDP-N-acetylmuramate--L-alanine ligase, partial [Alkalispirochaetaceae bacterium]